MTFHSATTPRIREISSIISMEYRITLHYSYTNCAVRVDNAMVVAKSEKVNHEKFEVKE